MAVTLNIALDADLVGTRLADLVGKGSDLSPLMATIGNLLEGSTKDRLRASNTAPDGAPWPPSLRATIEGGKTLFDSGRLANSITNIPGPTQVEVGSNVVYAGIHQTGGTIVPKTGKALAFALPGGEFAVVGQVTIPARPYLGISATDAEDIGAVVSDYFDFGDVP